MPLKPLAAAAAMLVAGGVAKPGDTSTAETCAAVPVDGTPGVTGTAVPPAIEAIASGFADALGGAG